MPEVSLLSNEYARFAADCQAQTARLQGEQLTLRLASRSECRLDAGRRPMHESPLFGGPAQHDLFSAPETCPACDGHFSGPGYQYTARHRLCPPCGAIAEADPVDGGKL